MAIQNIFEETERLKADIDNLSVGELKKEMAENEDLLLLDIREIQEQVDLGTIPGAIHCARGMMEFWASPASPYYRDYFQQDRRTVVFCAGGGRSVLAVKSLQAMGFEIQTPGGGGWEAVFWSSFPAQRSMDSRSARD